MAYKTLSACIALFIITTLSHGREMTPDKIKRIRITTDSIIKSQINTDKIAGAVVLIKKQDKVLFRKAYGFACKYDFNHHQVKNPEKMTVRHLFDIASLTKVIGTTTSIMLLADRGLIDIDEPVSNYIKAFDSPVKRNIRIRHLLTHTAGMYEWFPLYYIASDKNETYRLIENLPLKFPVGQQRKYSDLGFILLGEIIETVAGQPLEEFMKENIFNPLRMKNTVFNPNKKGKFRRIATTSPGNPYERRMVYDSTLGYNSGEIDPVSWNGWRNYNLRGEVNDGNTWYANGGISGAAGLFSTVGDIMKITDMLINMGKIRSGQFISEETIITFLTKDKFGNGLGWMMDPVNSFMKGAPEGTFGHTGFTGTSIVVLPSEGISVIILINRQNTGLQNGEYYNVNPIRLAVFKAVCGF